MEAGKIIKLSVLRKSDIGYILGDNEEEVLLHFNDCGDQTCEVGEEVNAFLYFDHKKRLAATLILPKITAFECGFAEVVETAHYGVFVNIGIRKDILLSKDRLPLDPSLWPQVGDVVYGFLANKNNTGITFQLGDREDLRDIKVKAPKEIYGQKINARVLKGSDAGVNVLTEEHYLGFIHHTQFKTQPRIGSLVEGRVINVKDNGEINLSLIPQKEIAIQDDTSIILNYLSSHLGKMPLGDQSSPEEIKELLNISKSAFKRALGQLLKENKIKQNEEKKITSLIS